MYESDVVPLRQCAHCRETFPLTAEYFHRAKDYPGGFNYVCKPCNLRRHKTYRSGNAMRYAQEGHTIAPLKRCSSCGEEKPATSEHFGSNKYQKDGLRSQCKTCVNRLQQERYPDRLSQRLAYKDANRERITEQNKEYRERNRELIRQRNRQLYQRLGEAGKLDRAKRNQQTRAWRERNPGHTREYYERNRDAYLARTHLRLARKAKLPNDFTANDWQFALDHFGGCCAVCGRPAGLWHTLAMDHWIPLSAADCPGTVPHNIVPLCHGTEGCNNSKNRRPAEEWLTDKFGDRKAAAILLRIAEFFSHVRQVD